MKKRSESLSQRGINGGLTRRTVLKGAGTIGLAAAASSLPFVNANAATTIRWWSPQSSTEQLAAYKYQIKTFEAAHPGVKVVFEKTSDEGYSMQLAAAFASGPACQA